MNHHDRTILFVEDDSFVLTLYKSRLQAAGFSVHTVRDGLAAIEVLPRIQPDAVILDLMLPKLHGLEVLKFIRADVDLKATTVVILSNAYMEGLATAALQAGANAGILKTECTPSKLIRMLRDLVKKTPTPGTPLLDTGDQQTPTLHAMEVVAQEACRESARRELLKCAPRAIARLRQECLAFVKMGGPQAGREVLNSLYRRVHSLNARAGLGGCTRIANLASAFEAMLFEIVFQPPCATQSIMQTTVQAVDCLARLIENKNLDYAGPNRQHKMLVVDDDEVCNYAIVRTLKRARFDAVSVTDPKTGLARLKTEPFDVVLLDIMMPELDGFQVCEELRRIPHHRTTPVIFITSHGESQNRAQGVLAGGDDLITKPISPLELTLKVTIRLLQPDRPATATVLEPDVNAPQDGCQEPSHTLTADAADSPTERVRANDSLTLAAAPSKRQASQERSRAEAPIGLEQAVPTGMDNFGRDRRRAPVISPHPAGASAVSNRESASSQRPQPETMAPHDAVADLPARLREQERVPFRLRHEDEALRADHKAHLTELVRAAQQLEEARVQNRSLERQLAALKGECGLTQAKQWQRDQEALKQRLQTETEARERMAARLAEALQLRDLAEARARKATAEAAIQRAQLDAQARAAQAAKQRQAEVWRSLEQALAERKQTEEQLRRERDGEQDRRQAEARTLAENRIKLECKDQALAAAHAKIASLEERCAEVEMLLKRARRSPADAQAQSTNAATRHSVPKDHSPAGASACPANLPAVGSETLASVG